MRTLHFGRDVCTVWCCNVMVARIEMGVGRDEECTWVCGGGPVVAGEGGEGRLI